MTKTRVVFACGGSGGDIYPALAIAEALPAGFEAIIVGSTVGLEARLAAQHGLRFVATAAAPLAGTGLSGKARSVISTVIGATAARRVLKREDVRLVFGFGGYASAPAVLAARSLGIPIILFEANAIVGTANRLLGRYASHVVLGAATATAPFRCPRSVTGVPIRTDILSIRAAPPDDILHVLVCGGSFGSRFLDEMAAELLARVVACGIPVDVHHIGDEQRAAMAYERVGIAARVTMFDDDMAAAYRRANVAIVAAGATTLAELAAVGLPSVIVPLVSAARDHQTANAREFAAKTGAVWCRESDWDAQMLAAHLVSLTRPSVWKTASDAMHRPARRDATEAAVRTCLDVLRAADPTDRADEAT